MTFECCTAIGDDVATELLNRRTAAGWQLRDARVAFTVCGNDALRGMSMGPVWHFVFERSTSTLAS